MIIIVTFIFNSIIAIELLKSCLKPWKASVSWNISWFVPKWMNHCCADSPISQTPCFLSLTYTNLMENRANFQIRWWIRAAEADVERTVLELVDITLIGRPTRWYLCQVWSTIGQRWSALAAVSSWNVVCSPHSYWLDTRVWRVTPLASHWQELF